MASPADVFGFENMMKLEQMLAEGQPKQVAMAQPAVPAMPQQALPQAKQTPLPQAASQPKLGFAEQYEQALNQSLAGRRSATDDLQAQLKERLGKQFGLLETANLAPAMAFADSLTGTRMAGSYQAPTAAKENAIAAEKLQEQIRKQEEGMSGDQLGYLKLRLQEEMADQRDRRMMGKASTSLEDAIRRQYLGNKVVKDFAEIDSSASAIESNPAMNGADQQAFVYNFMKLLDPGSVVRETEYAMAASNAGKINQLYNLAAKWNSGTPLTADQVADMKQTVRNLYSAYRRQYDDTRSAFSELAEAKGINPKFVTIDTYGVDKRKAPTANKITVTNGTETLQIDPSDLADAMKDGFRQAR